MAETKTTTSRERTNFSKIRTAIQIPNLIEVQKNSYERFLQMNMLPEEREDTGLQAVFNSVFPISDFRGVSTLEFISYSIGNWECKCGNLKGLHHLRSTCKSAAPRSRRIRSQSEPTVMCPKCGTTNKNQVTFCNKCGDPVQLNLKYDVAECQERGMTYAAPLKVIIRLTIFDKDPDTGAKTIRDIKEQEVYFGEIPLMTENGTFIINGTERVIVSQLHRSPGVFFESTPSKSYFLGKIIPYRGSWVEFEYETAKNILYVRIDRKRKFLATIFLRALGLKSDEEIIRAFYKTDRLTIEGKKIFWNVSDNIVGLEGFEGHRQSQDERSSGPRRKEDHLFGLQPHQAGEGRAIRSQSGGSRRRICGRRRRRHQHRRSHRRNQQRTDSDHHSLDHRCRRAGDCRSSSRNAMTSASC